jgi:hypothetical protein
MIEGLRNKVHYGARAFREQNYGVAGKEAPPQSKSEVYAALRDVLHVSTKGGTPRSAFRSIHEHFTNNFRWVSNQRREVLGETPLPENSGLRDCFKDFWRITRNLKGDQSRELDSRLLQFFSSETKNALFRHDHSMEAGDHSIVDGVQEA